MNLPSAKASKPLDICKKLHISEAQLPPQPGGLYLVTSPARGEFREVVPMH